MTLTMGKSKLTFQSENVSLYIIYIINIFKKNSFWKQNSKACNLTTKVFCVQNRKRLGIKMYAQESTRRPHKVPAETIHVLEDLSCSSVEAKQK